MMFSELFDRFERELQRYAYVLAKDTDEADDLVQETFIRAMGNLALLEQLSIYQQRAWLRHTLKNRFLDTLRSRRREQNLLAQLAESDDESFLPDLASAEVFRFVPERFQSLVHQHFVLGMTSEEIARSLGVPAATVRSRLHLAIKWLRDHRERWD